MHRRLTRKIHVSWIISWVSFGFLGGVALCMLPWSSCFADPAWLVVGISLLAIAVFKRIRAVLILTLAAGLLIGLYRGNVEHANADYRNFVGHYVQLTGTVADDPTFKNNQTGMKLSNVRIENQKLGGQVWVGTTSKLELKRDYNVELSGKLKPGFGSFPASMSFASLTKAAPPASINALVQSRDNFAAGLRKSMPEPQASLGLGYLTGQHNNLPQTLTKQLQLVGLIHLVIAGGYNVTILVRFARRFFAKYSRYLAAMAAVIILLGITMMTGFVAPMARTAIVTGLSLAAWFYGRRIHPLVLLPFAAAITAFADPAFVWGDVGWYLTFIAYGGLIMLGPLLKQFFWGVEPKITDDEDLLGKHYNGRTWGVSRVGSGTVKQILVDTVSVQIVTMPLLALAFHQYSIYGLPANLLVLPLMPLTMLFTVIAGLGGMIFPASTAHLIGWPAAGLLGYTQKVAGWLATAPGADASANFSVSGLVLSYAVVLLVGLELWRKTHYNFRTENVVE